MEHLSWESVPVDTLSENMSRRVITGEKAMIVQFDLKKDAVVPEHSHEAEQLSYVVIGSLRFEVEGKETVVRAGEVIVIPSNVPHRAIALEDTRNLDVFSPIRDDFLEGNDAYLRR
jgi:quercetin dioxygenase-like cupin family protein